MSETGVPVWIEEKEPINETLYWLGVVANPEAWKKAPFVMTNLDNPWYHCRACIDAGRPRHAARLSIAAKFCSECGQKIEWPE